MTYSRVYCTIQVMVKDEQETLDLLQDSYIKAFKHLNQFEGTEKFLPWIQQIARNTAKDWLKKKHPAFFTDLRGENETEWESPAEEQIIDANDESWPEKLLDREETARLIRKFWTACRKTKELSSRCFIMRSCLSNRLLCAGSLRERRQKSAFLRPAKDRDKGPGAGEEGYQALWSRSDSFLLCCCAARGREMSFPIKTCSARSWRKPLPGQMPRRPIPQQPVPPGPKQPGAVQQPSRFGGQSLRQFGSGQTGGHRAGCGCWRWPGSIWARPFGPGGSAAACFDGWGLFHCSGRCADSSPLVSEQQKTRGTGAGSIQKDSLRRTATPIPRIL